MKTLLALLVLAGFVFSASAQINTNQPARFKTKVVSYEGKIGSGAFDTSICPTPSALLPGNGGTDEVTTPGHESKLVWKFVGRNGGKDFYQFSFTRMTKAGVSVKTTDSKEISFDGRRIVIFKDDFHTVIIDSPSEKELKDARPKREPKPHAPVGAEP